MASFNQYSQQIPELFLLFVLRKQQWFQEPYLLIQK
nr:MAG TPA: hypothetical protein [Caudoviricetes sp.]